MGRCSRLHGYSRGAGLLPRYTDIGILPAGPVIQPGPIGRKVEANARKTLVLRNLPGRGG